MNSNTSQNFLICLEEISLAASGCNLDFSKLSNAKNDIREISAFLSITAEQAIFFSCLAELSLQRTVTLENLSKHLKCSVLKLITFMSEIEALERKGYIRKALKKRSRKYSYNDIGFTVPHNVIEALRNSDVRMLETSTSFDLPGFLKQVGDMVEERNSNSLTTEQLMAETEFLISNNAELPYVSYIDSVLSETISKCTMFSISYVRLKGQHMVNIDFFADAAFDDLSNQLSFSQQVYSGNHELVTTGLLKTITSEFDGNKMVTLSPDTAKVLYQAYPALLVADPEKSGMIKNSTLKDKKLFFNEETLEQLKPLEKVLKTAKFREYREELSRNNLTQGITAIFYGHPGTGKTETAYQLARKTGRDIMMVDLSQTKSKWFGESEKLTKKIFDDYAELLSNSEVEPILFINEADGLFTRRLDLNARGTSSDQAINTIQNILLQALESFQGILIATTNMTDNLDKAFERRFTFRVNFPRPDYRVRQRIWKNKLPELAPRDALLLGEKFDITGADIDVQVRHLLLKKVINKNVKILDTLVQSCSKDHGFTSKRKIGF